MSCGTARLPGSQGTRMVLLVGINGKSHGQNNARRTEAHLSPCILHILLRRSTKCMAAAWVAVPGLASQVRLDRLWEGKWLVRHEHGRHAFGPPSVGWLFTPLGKKVTQVGTKWCGGTPPRAHCSMGVG